MLPKLLLAWLVVAAKAQSSGVLKILCLHGGGSSASSFESNAGIVALQSSLGSGYEFVFAQGAYGPGGGTHMWIADPPGGKNQPTTDANFAINSVS